MKLLGKRILVRPTELPEKTSGGIFLPQTMSEVPYHKNSEGVIMAIGSGCQYPIEYQKGSRVFLEMYQAKEVKMAGLDCLLCDQSSVIGIEANGAFHPIGDRILLKPIKTVARDSGIVRPSAYDHDDDTPIECSVHLLGSGPRNKKGEVLNFIVKVGDRVLVMPAAGRDVDTNGEHFKLVQEKHILAVIE